jgi:hypothetical protein
VPEPLASAPCRSTTPSRAPQWFEHGGVQLKCVTELRQLIEQGMDSLDGAAYGAPKPVLQTSTASATFWEDELAVMIDRQARDVRR